MTDLDERGHSREGKCPSYGRINTVYVTLPNTDLYFSL